MSDSHREVLRLSEQVRSLKEDVFMFRDKYEDALRREERLLQRLQYFEQRYENELINDSLEMSDTHEKVKQRNRYNHYSLRNSSSNFSTNFSARNNRNSGRFY